MKRPFDCSNTSRAVRGVCVAILLLIASVHARAATVTCIVAGDTAGLKAALAAAESDNDDNVIELQAGLYVMPMGFQLSYNASADHNDLTIEGGYGPDMTGPCGAAPTIPDGRQTLLYGGTLYIHMAGEGSFSLQSVTVENMSSNDPVFPTVDIGGYIDFTGDVTIRHALFLGNDSATKSAVYIFAAKGSLVVKDSVFANNQSEGTTESAVHMGSLSTSAASQVEILNSTFANNSSTAAAGLDVYSSLCDTIAANNIFWNSGSAAVRFEHPEWTYLWNSDFSDLSEAANAAQATALSSLDPLFQPDLSLHDLSPLRDKGAPSGFTFLLEPYDVIGNPRVYGANPEIGAFEIQDVIFANGFERVD
jgi:hypothetical protein